MIYSQTLKTLDEDELSILFLICEKMFEPIGLNATYHFLKMLRLDITLKIIDVLKNQALDEKKYIFDSLKKKLAE